MSIKKILVCFFCMIMLLSGCSAKNENVPEQEEKAEETPSENQQETVAIPQEYVGNYLLTSMIISDKEYITEDFMQYQIDNDMFFKMTVLEDGAVFIDFISEQMRGYINPETSTIGIGSNGIPFTYENGTMTLVTTADYVYTFEKKDDLSPVVMLYRNDYFILEDPYLLPWANVPDEDGTGLFLFSKQIWLVEHSYPKDDESEELREALNLFQDNNPLMDLNEGTHYSYTEDGDAFFLDVLFVTPTNYHYFRMWCPSSDRDKYEDLLVDLMSNHVYVLEYYQ